jgi:hypothetical protein
MNPYSSPNSHGEKRDSHAPRISVSIAIAILSVPAIYIIVFPVVGLIKDLLAIAGLIGSFKFRLINNLDCHVLVAHDYKRSIN